MSKLNFLVYLNTYSDVSPSNAPSLSNFKWTRDLQAIPASNPVSEAFTLAPGESRTLYNGLRTLTADGTTRYGIALKPLSSNNYRISATAGTAPGFRAARALGIDATTQVTAVVNGPIVTFSGPAVSGTAIAATFSGQVTGMSSDVLITANTAGAAGNSIAFSSPDGLTTINTLIANWNIANPSNTITLTSGDGTQTPLTGAVIQLSGGLNAVNSTAMDTTALVIGDSVRIGTLFNVLNQGEWKVIAKAANSFTVENEVGVNEGPITLTSDFANQIQAYSSTGVQKGDTIVIQSGFSPVTWGSYDVTDVTANYVEFYSTDVLPTESNITSTDLAIYSSAKNLVYLESDQNTALQINGNQVATVQPFVINNATQPGVFMLKSTIWNLTITNSSLNTANVFVASVE